MCSTPADWMLAGQICQVALLTDRRPSTVKSQWPTILATQDSGGAHFGLVTSLVFKTNLVWYVAQQQS